MDTSTFSFVFMKIFESTVSEPTKMQLVKQHFCNYRTENRDTAFQSIISKNLLLCGTTISTILLQMGIIKSFFDLKDADS